MLDLLQRKNNNKSIFDEFFNTPFFNGERSLMRTDLKEEENNYILDIEIPGFNKEDLKISLEDGYLTVEASKEESSDEKDERGNYVRKERYYGKVSRSYYVGRSLSEESVKAAYSNGILTLTVPKEKETDNKKYIEVK